MTDIPPKADLRSTESIEMTMHELSNRGMAWADADAAFRALDDTTKSTLSLCMADHQDKPVSKAEQLARIDERYTAHLDALSEARREASRARVSYDTFKTFIDLRRSQLATERAEAQIR